jgi:hypothetical protein
VPPVDAVVDDLLAGAAGACRAIVGAAAADAGPLCGLLLTPLAHVCGGAQRLLEAKLRARMIAAVLRGVLAALIRTVDRGLVSFHGAAAMRTGTRLHALANYGQLSINVVMRLQGEGGGRSQDARSRTIPLPRSL